MNDPYDALIRILAHKLGNKRYLRDLECMFERIKPHLTHNDQETIWHLVRDLKNENTDDRRQPWTFR